MSVKLSKSSKRRQFFDKYNKRVQEMQFENREMEQASSPVTITDSQTDKSEEQCCVCLDNKKCMVFTECGHLCVCHSCSTKLKICPVCRKESKIVKVHT
jgi:hypothetical protein